MPNKEAANDFSTLDFFNHFMGIDFMLTWFQAAATGIYFTVTRGLAISKALKTQASWVHT